MQKPREIAYRVLRARNSGEGYVEDLFDDECARSPLAPLDRRLAQEIVYGSVRWQGTLDWLIDRYTQGRPQKPGLQTLLRTGLYQLFWLDRVPDHAVVHETVEIAKFDGFGAQAGFVNALLRNAARDREKIRAELHTLQQDTQADAPALASAWSQPSWLVERWLARWNRTAVLKLLAWNNSTPATFARVNTIKADVGAILQRWREEDGVVYDFFLRDWAGENLVFALKEHRPFQRMGSFREGWFYIQDPSTLLAPVMLYPRPGETVLDLCSAPGGKTTLMAQLMRNQGRLVAMDSSEARLALVRENCARLGVKCVETAVFRPDQAPVEQFDRVLLDAPCSNTGVLRRRLDLRWRVREQEIARLARTQATLLDQAAAALKLGGKLAYSTCSLEMDENESIVHAFIQRNPRFRLEEERTVTPFQDEVDGAYVALLRRVL